MTEQNDFKETKAVIKKINLFKNQTKINWQQINEQDLKLVVCGWPREGPGAAEAVLVMDLRFHFSISSAEKRSFLLLGQCAVIIAIRQGASAPGS